MENLSRHLEDRLDKNSIKIQDNEKVMYNLNTAMEKNFMYLEKKFHRLETLSELYSKKQNLIINGIPESNQNESKEETLQIVKKFLIQQLKINQNITLIDAHRLKAKKFDTNKPATRSTSQDRPIIIRLSNLFDKDLILRSLKNLKPTDSNKQKIFVNQHLPASMFKQKKKLNEQYRKAKSEKLSPRWFIDFLSGNYCLDVDGTKFFADEA